MLNGQDFERASVYHLAMDAGRASYTPSELNREVRMHIEAGFPRIWVEGEISNLSRPASGHLYFSLKDDRAQVRCALFRSHAQRLGFRPENGMQVQARGRVSLYEPRGDYQLITDLLEDSGEGRLRAAFEALKKKLEAEGLFAAVAKQPLPHYPERIAVVTSSSGAVIRDILQVLRRRWPLARVRLYPSSVQGEDAPASLVAALRAANAHAWAEAIILGRGGGSLEDLAAFNDERVARAVFASAIPVVSAVGHETDFSICDFVADVRAPTPSAAAEQLTPDRQTLQRAIAGFETRIARRLLEHLQRLGQQHDHLAHRLGRQHPGFRIGEYRKSLQRSSARLATLGHQLTPSRRALAQRLVERLYALGQRLVPQRRQSLQELARTLHAVSPLPTLERGYAVVLGTTSGQTISSVRQASPGDAVTAQLHDGRLYGTVDRVTDEKLQTDE